MICSASRPCLRALIDALHHSPATTSSDHDHPIFRNLAKDRVVNGANQLWVADVTYVAVAMGFVYVAVILDAWSRRVVGYAISRSIDVRLTLAALNAAIEDRRPPAGCLHHSDRGSQYAAQAYRLALDRHASSARWAGAATHTTTPKRRAS